MSTSFKITLVLLMLVTFGLTICFDTYNQMEWWQKFFGFCSIYISGIFFGNAISE